MGVHVPRCQGGAGALQVGAATDLAVLQMLGIYAGSVVGKSEVRANFEIPFVYSGCFIIVIVFCVCVMNDIILGMLVLEKP